jgi:Arc/MetJ-type ribon-helix-helix transcriptional regulator
MSQLEGQESTAIMLPRELIEKIEARIRGTAFVSPSAYVKYVLEEVMQTTADGDPGFSPEDEEAIKEKLRALGYLG